MGVLLKGGVEMLAEAGAGVLLVPALPLHAGVHQALIAISTLTDGEALLHLRQAEETSGTSGHPWKVSFADVISSRQASLLLLRMLMGILIYIIQQISQML